MSIMRRFWNSEEAVLSTSFLAGVAVGYVTVKAIAESSPLVKAVGYTAGTLVSAGIGLAMSVKSLKVQAEIRDEYLNNTSKKA